MSYSIDWITKIVVIPASDMVLVSANYYSLDLSLFHKEIRRLEWTEGLWAIQVLEHTNSKPSFAGASYAAFDEIINGYTVQFEAGIERVDLVGSNNNIIDVLIYSGAGVVPTNSAGLQDLSTLLASAYGGQVVVDPLKGQDGTSVPVGTYNKPVKTMADALTIADRIGVKNLLLTRNMIVYEDLSAEFHLIGDSPFNVITCDPIASLAGCSLEKLSVEGELDGLNVLTRCSLRNVTGVSGHLEKCAFTAEIDLVGETYIYECYSQVAGLGFFGVKIHSHTLVVRDFHGSIQVSQVTGGTHSIEINGGRLVIDTATCTGGTIYARGKPFEILGAEGAGITVVEQFDSGLSSIESLQLAEIHGQTDRAVHIDTELVSVGNGYQQTPWNNVGDAIDNAEAKGLKRLHILSDTTIDRNLKNFTVIGIGLPTIDMNNQIMDNSIFERVRITGEQQGIVEAVQCSLFSLKNLLGVYFTCAIVGTIKPAAGGNGTLLWECTTPFVGVPYTIDMSNIGAKSINIHNSSGNVVITNMTNASDVVDYHGLQGSITIDTTCTAGTIINAGNIEVIGEGGGVTVDNTLVGSSLMSNNVKLAELYKRMDLELLKPNIYANDASSIVNADFTLTKTDNGNGTSTVQRS